MTPLEGNWSAEEVEDLLSHAGPSRWPSPSVSHEQSTPRNRRKKLRTSALGLAAACSVVGSHAWQGGAHKPSHLHARHRCDDVPLIRTATAWYLIPLATQAFFSPTLASPLPADGVMSLRQDMIAAERESGKHHEPEIGGFTHEFGMKPREAGHIDAPQQPHQSNNQQKLSPATDGVHGSREAARYQAKTQRSSVRAIHGMSTLNRLGLANQMPFEASEVGAAGTSHRSLGLFPEGYVFRPRTTINKVDNAIQAEGGGFGTDSSGRSSSTDTALQMSMPIEVSHSNLLRHGWSRWQLDDDARLSVPDEQRRPRRETAAQRAADLLGKKWWRWTPGAGYTYGWSKDLSMYTHGPGIALAQLAPPNHKYKVPRLPLIPNSSKRELAWWIFWMILVTGVCALLLELRAARRRMRKGKGVSRASHTMLRQPNEGMITLSGWMSSTSAWIEGPRALTIGSRPIHSRQRSKALALRQLCEDALNTGAKKAAKSGAQVKAALSIGTNHPPFVNTTRHGHGDTSATIELMENGSFSSSSSGIDSNDSIISIVSSPSLGSAPMKRHASHGVAPRDAPVPARPGLRSLWSSSAVTKQTDFPARASDATRNGKSSPTPSDEGYSDGPSVFSPKSSSADSQGDTSWSRASLPKSPVLGHEKMESVSPTIKRRR